MHYLRQVIACNDFDPALFRPLLLNGSRVGFIRQETAAALADYPTVFALSDREVAFVDRPNSRATLTDAVAEVSASLVQRGLIRGLRQERFAVMAEWGSDILFEVDRGAVPFFGTRSYGVHLNGLLADALETTLWIGKRAPDKKIAPNKLDNIVAGGISSGYDARQTLLKEAGEEAGMPESLAAQAIPVGALIYRMALDDGSRDDVLFVYDITLPPSFVPHNTDGEIEDFRTMPLTQCLALVAGGDEFKFNVNLVLIDLAIRRGIIGPEHPHYLALIRGLKGGLIRN